MSDQEINIANATEFAEKYKRERDGAREQARRLDGAYEDATKYYERMIELKDERDRLLEAARAVIERWDQPSWKDVEPTAAVIYRLRNVIQEITGEDWQ